MGRTRGWWQRRALPAAPFQPCIPLSHAPRSSPAVESRAPTDAQVIRQSMSEFLQAIEGAEGVASEAKPEEQEPAQEQHAGHQHQQHGGTGAEAGEPAAPAGPAALSVMQLELRQAPGGALEFSPSLGEVQVRPQLARWRAPCLCM